MFYLGLSLNRFVHVFSPINTFVCVFQTPALSQPCSCFGRTWQLPTRSFHFLWVAGAGGGGWGCWQGHPGNRGYLSPGRGCPLWGMAAAGPLPVLESRRVLGASLCIPSRDQKDQQLKNLIEKVLWKRKVKLRNSY